MVITCVALANFLGRNKRSLAGVGIPAVSVAAISIRHGVQHHALLDVTCGQITMFPLLTYGSAQFHFIPFIVI